MCNVQYKFGYTYRYIGAVLSFLEIQLGGWKSLETEEKKNVCGLCLGLRYFNKEEVEDEKALTSGGNRDKRGIGNFYKSSLLDLCTNPSPSVGI